MSVNYQRLASTLFSKKKSSSAFLPSIYEAIQNAIQSMSKSTSKGNILIKINRENTTEGRGNNITSVEIIDYGQGFNRRNRESFNDVCSDLKSTIGGKGVGHIMWLLAFEYVDIHSIFQEDDIFYEAKFRFDNAYKEIIDIESTAQNQPKTSIHLINPLKPINIGEQRLVNELTKHFIVAIQRNQCGIVVHDEQKIDLNEYYRNTILDTKSKSIELYDTKVNYTFNLLKLDLISEHEICLVAQERGTTYIPLSKILPDFPETLIYKENEGCYFITVVSELLDQRTNTGRDGYTHFKTLKDEDVQDENMVDALLGEIDIEQKDIKERDFYDYIVKYLTDEHIQEINSLQEEKKIALHSLLGDIEENRYLLAYIASDPSIANDISLESIKKKPNKVIDDISEKYEKSRKSAISVIQQARNNFKQDNDYNSYKQYMDEYFEKYIRYNNFELARYIAHRKTTLNILQDGIYIYEDIKKAEKEDFIQNILCPKCAHGEQKQYFEHNLWIIDERLAYHSIIVADKRLKDVPYLESESDDRPDIFLIMATDNDPTNLTSITLVEIKRPQRNDYTSDDNPLKQINGYYRQIKEGLSIVDDNKKKKIKIQENIPVYGYIIADYTPTLKTVFDDSGADIYEYRGHENVNLMYWNKDNGRFICYLIEYKNLVKQAEQRNRVFFKLMNLDQ